MFRTNQSPSAWKKWYKSLSLETRALGSLNIPNIPVLTHKDRTLISLKKRDRKKLSKTLSGLSGIKKCNGLYFIPDREPKSPWYRETKVSRPKQEDNLDQHNSYIRFVDQAFKSFLKKKNQLNSFGLDTLRDIVRKVVIKPASVAKSKILIDLAKQEQKHMKTSSPKKVRNKVFRHWPGVSTNNEEQQGSRGEDLQVRGQLLQKPNLEQAKER